MADLPESIAPRITLRQLPLAARLVLSVFLIAVGLGYFSAMIQLHMKHSKKDGEPLPSGADVVEVFAGMKKPDETEKAPCSRIDTLVSGDASAVEISKDNMAPAFFAKSKGWTAEQATRSRDLGALKAERQGELNAFLAWIRSDAAKKKEAYEKDSFPRPDDKPISAKFLATDGGVMVKSLVENRCQNCHAEQAPSLETYADLEPLITPPSQELIDGKWVRSSRQTSVEHLTQSTHAHLLTFAVLFAMTGLTFAFTTYWAGVRCVVGPVVLLAQVADISCWWLARVPHYGVYFAYAILGTGAIVAIGMTMQIVLSLLNMYGIKGKIVVMLVLFGVGSSLAFIGLKVIQPALDIEKLEAEKAKTPAAKPPEEPKKPIDVALAPKVEPGQLEKLVMGPIEPTPELKFNGKGTMAPAFFGKDSSYKRQLKDKPDDKAKLDAERRGEQMALQAWLQSASADREKTFEADSFPLPKDLVGKPITADFLTDAKSVKVKSILNDRCVRCHCAGGEQEDYPLETYEQLMKYIAPKKDGGK